MTERYDLLHARESGDKTYWTKCGAMFPTKAGTGFNIVLDVMPAPNDGQFRLLAMVPKPRDDAPPARSNGGSTRRAAPPADDLDDDIPFIAIDAREPGTSKRGIR
jgi:hypothetical protein